MARKYNFNPGPAMLPLPVLEKVQSELLDYQGEGFSILESSHRTDKFVEIIESAKSKILKFLNLTSSEYSVLFLHGGVSTDFYRVPMNLLQPSDKVDFIETGVWVQKAIKEAKHFGEAKIIASSEDKKFSYIPKITADDFTPDAKYTYLCSNNTIYGTQYHHFPTNPHNAPLVGDFTSDILSRKIAPEEIKKFGIIIAGAQKNLGPAGLSIVIIRQDILAQCRTDIPSLCSYPVSAEANSLFNTSPVFQIYFVNLVLQWMEGQGGLEKLEKQNQEKANLLYQTIDQHDLYQGNAVKEDRSTMNVTWTLPSQELTEKFISQASDKNIVGIKGHKFAGGLRASLYNAFPLEGVEVLCDYMKEFSKNY